MGDETHLATATNAVRRRIGGVLNRSRMMSIVSSQCFDFTLKSRQLQSPPLTWRSRLMQCAYVPPISTQDILRPGVNDQNRVPDIS